MSHSAASVLQRILNEARKLGVANDLLTRRYVFERFLARLAQSDWHDKLVLKGAMALVAVTHNYARTTRDLDMLGLEQMGADETLRAIETIASITLADGDPIVFDAATFKISTINVGADEPGHQVTGEARIGTSKIPLKIEISHGHIVSPTPVEMLYPTVLADSEAPKILCYTPETMLAEKFEAVCSLGVGTSRFKDFYDIRELSRTVEFDGMRTAQAFRATFGKRETSIPDVPPESFAASFYEIGERGWRSFHARQARPDPQSFADMVAEIEPFVMEIAAMARDDAPTKDWVPDTGWIEAPRAGVPALS